MLKAMIEAYGTPTRLSMAKRAATKLVDILIRMEVISVEEAT
jgi:hypothetical protein